MEAEDRSSQRVRCRLGAVSLLLAVVTGTDSSSRAATQSSVKAFTPLNVAAAASLGYDIPHWGVFGMTLPATQSDNLVAATEKSIARAADQLAVTLAPDPSRARALLPTSAAERSAKITELVSAWNRQVFLALRPPLDKSYLLGAYAGGVSTALLRMTEDTRARRPVAQIRQTLDEGLNSLQESVKELLADSTAGTEFASLARSIRQASDVPDIEKAHVAFRNWFERVIRDLARDTPPTALSSRLADTSETTSAVRQIVRAAISGKDALWNYHGKQLSMKGPLGGDLYEFLVVPPGMELCTITRGESVACTALPPSATAARELFERLLDAVRLALPGTGLSETHERPDDRLVDGYHFERPRGTFSTVRVSVRVFKGQDVGFAVNP